MAINLRNLYAKAAFMRPDVEVARVGFAVQEGVREVCRRTSLARATATVTLDLGGNTLALSLTDANLLSVHRVTFLETGATTATELSPTTFKDLEGQDATTSAPVYYAQQGDTLQVYPATDTGGTATVYYSYVPTTELDSVDLPETAVTAIEAKAEAMLLRLPGEPYQNMGMAQERERDFHRAINNLKAIAFYGETGDVITVSASVPGAP